MKGEDIYVNVFDADTFAPEEKKPESHREYLDVQFLGSGEEDLRFTTDTGNYRIVESHPDRDLYFYDSVENEGVVHSKPGNFCVFFPTDIHRPQCSTTKSMSVRKAVAKVKVTLL